MRLRPDGDGLLFNGIIDFLLDLGKFGDEEQEIDDASEGRNTKINPLQVAQSVRITGLEEGTAGNDGSEDGSDTVPRLSEHKTESSVLRRSKDCNVRAGSHLEPSET